MSNLSPRDKDRKASTTHSTLVAKVNRPKDLMMFVVRQTRSNMIRNAVKVKLPGESKSSFTEYSDDLNKS